MKPKANPEKINPIQILNIVHIHEKNYVEHLKIIVSTCEKPKPILNKTIQAKSKEPLSNIIFVKTVDHHKSRRIL